MAKGKKTGGRRPGSQNKFSGELKDMILQALAQSGGVNYLKTQARDNPNAFLTLVGKVLPLQVGGDPNGVPIAVREIHNYFVTDGTADQA